ncbi:AMP nucleosidase [Candidatus Hydrogenedentota bacterium]
MTSPNHNHENLDKVDMSARDKVGISTLERYAGSASGKYQPYVLLTNFKRYADTFSETFHQPVHQGSAMRSCHSPEEQLTIVDYGVGSPVAALIIELLSFVNPKAVIMLGMCGGLRSKYSVGDFFNPIAAIREEGTSNAYMPPQCPSLATFWIQRRVCNELERRDIQYHTGVIHTTNVRLWEFKENFRRNLKAEYADAIDMECATLFTVGFAMHVPVGALMLISDLPLERGGVKTKESAHEIFKQHMKNHLEIGIDILKDIRKGDKKDQ